MKNNINSLKMVRKIRDSYYKQLSGKSSIEKIKFFKEKANIVNAGIKEKSIR